MKYKPKSYVVPTIYLLVLFMITAGVYFTKKTFDNYEEKEEYGNITFVSSSIFNRSIPIINILIETYITKGVGLVSVNIDIFPPLKLL